MEITITTIEARRIGDALGIAWTDVDLRAFQRGLEIEWEHGSREPGTPITEEEERVIGLMVWAHIRELPDYYHRLERLWSKARHDHEQAKRRKSTSSQDAARGSVAPSGEIVFPWPATNPTVH